MSHTLSLLNRILEETKDFIFRYVWLVTTLLSMLLVNRGTTGQHNCADFFSFPETVR